MLCSCFRIDPPGLVSALTAAPVLERYLDELSAELPGLADRGMINHLRRMNTLASRVLASGLEQLAGEDAAAADALLSDLFAVATYRGWPLPATALGEQDLPVAALPRGLLGADLAADGARLWLIDPQTLALARSREADVVAERP